ncbi:MAG: N-acetylmuramoyl-L-alanine amidase [Chloroflexi bacterium]|nr:N-acetylmuramoyl-L-alanine amidase [Chloroflexota bacterium]
MTTKRISFSIPAARERLAALGLAEEEIERSLELVKQKYGPVDQLVPGEYIIELPIEEAGVPVYTNQDVISVFYAAAREVGENGWGWLSRAGLTGLIHDRQGQYRGPAIDDLPGLTAAEKTSIKALLGLTEAPPAEAVPSFTWVGPTGNCASGRSGHQIEMIVVHFTASGSGTGTVSWFKNPQSKVSAHYVLDRDGKILQLVKDGDTAWHAGLPEDLVRNDTIRPNSRSIGIEIVNWGPLRKDGNKYYNWLGNEHLGAAVEAGGKYWEPYTEAQYKSLIELVAYLCKRYNVPHRYPLLGPGTYYEKAQDLAAFKGVLGHSAINRGKSDPGSHFDWDRLLDGLRASG